MNIKMRYLALIAIGVLMATNLTASEELQTTNENFKFIAGAGGFSCGKLIAVKIEGERFDQLYFFWAQGFLSGMNFQYLRTEEFATNLSDHDAHRIWLENYCEENPLDTYALAVRKLWRELRIRQKLDPDLLFIPKE